tara:strand:+ start:398 stop:1729 length:1332 start_codon:yes stop_codon:yes gene_type:complete
MSKIDKNKTIHILGGGPAGMSAAYYAHKNKCNYHLYESSNQVGGNAKTLNFDNFLIDTGAHRFHDKNKYITKDIKTLLGDNLNKVSSPSKIYFNNEMINFPIKAVDVINKLDSKTSYKIIIENILTIFNNNHNPRNFKELAYNNYGKTLSNLFLINYTEKLWGEQATNLDASISGGRLKNLDLYSILKNLILNKKDAKHIDGDFLYPKYGFGTIFNTILQNLDQEKVSLKTPIKNIIHDNNIIKKIKLNNNEEIDVDQVISTLPLPILIKQLTPSAPKHIKRIIDNIKYRDLKLFILFLNKESFSYNASIYFPEKEILFTRIYEPKNRSSYMSPRNKTSIVIEVPCSRSINDDSDDTKIYNDIKTFLINKKFITADEIINYKVLSMPFAYPVLKSDNNLTEVFNFIGKIKNINLIGRSAEFKYLHVHDLFNRSKQIIKSIIDN